MSLLEELARKKEGLSRVETADKSGPKLGGYVNEAEIEAYRQEVIESNIETWLEPLGEHTFQTYFVPLEEEDAIALKLNYHNDSKTPSDIEDTMTPEAITERISNLKAKVQAKIDEVLDDVKKDNIPGQAQDGVFIKMSSRSAKDSPVYSEGLKKLYLEYMSTCKERDVNAKAQGLLHAATKLLKVSSAETAFQFFTKSERIAQDMEVALAKRGEDFQMNVVIRRWTDIDIDMEFRGFYNNGKLTALSQYNYIVVFDRLLEEGRKEKIQQQIVEFFDSEIKPRLDAVGFKRYIVDFALTGENNDRIYVIELNPFLSSTDSALFSWKKEQPLLENGPFEFRLTTEKNPNLLPQLGIEWREVIECVPIPQ